MEENYSDQKHLTAIEFLCPLLAVIRSILNLFYICIPLTYIAMDSEICHYAFT